MEEAVEVLMISSDEDEEPDQAQRPSQADERGVVALILPRKHADPG